MRFTSYIALAIFGAGAMASPQIYRDENRLGRDFGSLSYDAARGNINGIYRDENRINRDEHRLGRDERRGNWKRQIRHDENRINNDLNKLSADAARGNVGGVLHEEAKLNGAEHKLAHDERRW